MNLLNSVIEEELNNLIDQNIKFLTIGNISELPQITRNSIEIAKEKTEGNDGLNLILAINYSGKWDIINAIKTLYESKK